MIDVTGAYYMAGGGSKYTYEVPMTLQVVLFLGFRVYTV